MIDKELNESLKLSGKYIRAYGIENDQEPEHQPPTHLVSQNTQQIFVIRDVWYALYTAMRIAITVTIVLWIFFVAISFQFKLPGQQIALLIILMIGLKSGWKTWKVHQPGVIINLSEGTLSFAAEDIENTFWEIITFKQFFNHWQRMSVSLQEILRIDNDTIKMGKGKNMVKYYGLNVSGTFGSQQIVFTKKQKRDECRAQLAHVLNKILNKKVKFDFNLNTGLSSGGQ